MKDKITVYVAGPYTHGDVPSNVRRAIEAADQLANLGFAPFVPHLYHFWDMVAPRSYEFWVDMDNQFLKKCDSILRLEGHSPGADAEEVLGTTLGMPLFYSIEEVSAHYGPQL